MKTFLLLCFLACALALCVGAAKKPLCNAGPGTSGCSITTAYCPGNCCNYYNCDWWEGDRYVRCEIDECNAALSDSCWRLACVDGEFDQQRWDELQREWAPAVHPLPDRAGKKSVVSITKTVLSSEEKIAVLEQRVNELEQNACKRHWTTASDGESAMVCQ